MRSLFVHNYRQKEVDCIMEAIHRRGKITLFHLNGVGKNPFFKLLSYRLEDKFADEYILSFDARNVGFEEFLKDLYCRLINLEESENVINARKMLKLVENLFVNKDELLILNLQFEYLGSDDKDIEQILLFLKQLRDSNPLRVIPIVHSFWTQEIISQLLSTKFGSLFHGNVFYHGAFKKQSFREAISYLENKAKTKLDDKEIKCYWELSGGIPFIYKQAFLYSQNSGKKVCSKKFIGELINLQSLENYIIQLKKDLGEDLIATLRGIIEGGDKLVFNSEAIKMLLEFDLIKKVGKNNYKILSSVLAKMLQDDKGRTGLGIDASGGLLLDGKRPHDLFTDTEMKIVSLMMQRVDLVSREDISKAIWGDSYLENYSDYAIDRHISNIRTKFKTHDLGNMVTVKGKGYLFQSVN